MRALSGELGGEVARIAERLGLCPDGLHEAAWERSERLFWVVSDPDQWPGPRTHGAIAGAWLHGALCGAAAHRSGTAAAARLVGAADLLEAVRALEAEASETGDSRATLARYGMVRARDQPAFAALAPDRAAEVVVEKTGMTSEIARELLGLFCVDGAVVARNALERVTRDPSPPAREVMLTPARARLWQQAGELMELNNFPGRAA